MPPPLSPNEDVKTKERKVMASETAQLDGKDETDEDDYDEDGPNDDSAQSSAEGKEGKGDELSRLRREKRLAMNRESARERRKRKKVLLETLEERVEQLAEQNRRYQLVNENLTAKVKRLEADLGFARSTITMLSNQNASNTGASAVHSSGVVPGPVPVGTIGGHQEALRRLVESQKMIQRDNSSLLIDSLINHRLSQQQVSDLQALQQANREMAWISTLGSLKQSGGMKASQGSLNLQQQNMGAKYLSVSILCIKLHKLSTRVRNVNKLSQLINRFARI